MMQECGGWVPWYSPQARTTVRYGPLIHLAVVPLARYHGTPRLQVIFLATLLTLKNERSRDRGDRGCVFMH